MPRRMAHVRCAGLITAVTPVLNGASYLRESIESVLSQGYPAVEYLVVDGGSTDDSLAIAREFGPSVRVIERPGCSQIAAVNLGFAEGHGEFFAIVNADDSLVPGSLVRSVAALERAPEAPYAYGDAIFVDAGGDTIGAYPVRAFSLQAMMQECIICQPATLIRATAFDAVGRMDERYDAAADYDLWIRLARSSPPPVRVEATLARARMHKAAKTFNAREQNLREVCGLIQRHYGYVPFSWIHAYAGLQVTSADQFFQPPTGSPARTLRTLALGMSYNKRKSVRFLREFCAEVIRLSALRRRKIAS